jgi:predicted GNAT family acetyltransferase
VSAPARHGTITPVGTEALDEIVAYLRRHSREAALLLQDLAARDTAPAARQGLSICGFRRDGRVVAVQGFYDDGRWLPHYEDPAALDPMLALAQTRRLRWVMGPTRVADAAIARLAAAGARFSYDERDAIHRLDAATLRPQPAPGVRRATEEDIPALAGLRLHFDAEYFGTPPMSAHRPWYLETARSYIARGAYLAERGGVAVAMAATEAEIPQVAQIGAVYTLPAYRAQGLARGVITALCQELLPGHQEVSLMVRTDNEPARRAYAALGFAPCGDYRMARLA